MIGLAFLLSLGVVLYAWWWMATWAERHPPYTPDQDLDEYDERF